MTLVRVSVSVSVQKYFCDSIVLVRGMSGRDMMQSWALNWIYPCIGLNRLSKNGPMSNSDMVSRAQYRITVIKRTETLTFNFVA